LAGEADGRRLVEEDVTILLMRAAVEAVVLWTVGEAGRSLGVDWGMGTLSPLGLRAEAALVAELLSLFVGEDEGEAASEDGEALVGDADEALVGDADDADDADLHSSASIAAGRT
jgi:hypothetical protein